jgi:ADP-ribosylglycohydrolase
MIVYLEFSVAANFPPTVGFSTVRTGMYLYHNLQIEPNVVISVHTHHLPTTMAPAVSTAACTVTALEGELVVEREESTRLDARIAALQRDKEAGTQANRDKDRRIRELEEELVEVRAMVIAQLQAQVNQAVDVLSPFVPRHVRDDQDMDGA